MFTDLYLGLIFLGLPLYVHNGYFDITKAKTLFFVILSCFYLLVMALCWLLEERRKSIPPLDCSEKSAFLLAAVSVLAMLCSGNAAEAFIGKTGRYQGTGMMLLYVFVFIIVRRHCKETKWAFRGLYVGLALSGALAVCNRLGWDVLGMSKNLTDFDQGRYISTVGNINFMASYCCLAVPACAVKAYQKKDALALSAAIIGLAGAVCSASFSAVMGLVGALALFPLFLPKEKVSHGSYSIALSSAVALGILAVIALNTFCKGVYLGRWENLLRFSPEWGTDRGKEWAHCWRMYVSLPIHQKLIGGGCGIVATLDARSRLFPDAVLNAAHNEYLQNLLQWGILGLGCYLGWIYHSFRVEPGKPRPENSLPWKMGALAYLIQATVNIAQTPAAPMIILFLALISTKCYNNCQQNHKIR